MNKSLLTAVLACVACAVEASGQTNAGVRLTSGDVTFDYAFNSNLPTTSFGSAFTPAMNFQVEGPSGVPSLNQLPRGNWFYRFDGDTVERQAANANIRTLTGTNRVDYWFNSIFTGGAANTRVPNARAHMDYNVFDTGNRSAKMTTHFCIENNGNTTLTGQLFFVADINLATTILSDDYQPVDSTLGKKWTLTDTVGPDLATGRMFAPGAIGAALDDYNMTIGALLSGGPNSFVPDLGYPGGTTGSQDWVAGVQIPFIVGPNSTNCNGIEIEIEMSVIPTPGAAAVLGLGGLMAARRRRGLSA